MGQPEKQNRTPFELLDLDGLRRGDDRAWTQAFQVLWPLALRAARHPEVRLSLEEAEEVANEALSQLVTKIQSVATVDQIRALVCTIAHCRAISVARHKSAAKRVPIPLSLDACPDVGGIGRELHYEENGQMPAIELQEMVLLLHRALEGLDAETRLLLVEKIGFGLTYEELSKKHRIPIGTACAKVARGLRKLRRLLDQSPVLMKELKAFLR